MWPLRHFCPPYIYHQSVELYAGLLHKAKRVCVGGGSAAWVRPTNNKDIAERTSNSIYSFLVNGSKKVNEVAACVPPKNIAYFYVYQRSWFIIVTSLEQGKRKSPIILFRRHSDIVYSISSMKSHDGHFWSYRFENSLRIFIRFAGDESAKWEIIPRFASSSVYGVCVIASFIFPTRALLAATRQRHESLLSLFFI